MTLVNGRYLVIVQPSGRPMSEATESDAKKHIEEMIRDRFADRRRELNNSGIFFKQTHRADEYKTIQAMHSVVPRHVPRPLGLVVSDGTGGWAMHGYLMEYIAGSSLDYVNEWMFAYGGGIIGQVEHAFGMLHSRGILHLDIRTKNIMVRKRDGNVFIIDPAPSRGFDPSTKTTDEIAMETEMEMLESTMRDLRSNLRIG